MSDSDSGERPPRWPDIERRSDADRRSSRPRRRLDDRAERFNPAERRSGKDRRDEDAWQPIALEPVRTAATGGENALVAAAAEARQRAHARYSNFKVGAALETVEGIAVVGCNIENATYGLTLCAERVALVKALSDGHEIFTRIAIVADTEAPTPPCGPCRQLLWEYCGDIDVILANTSRVTARYRLSALLPLPFDNRLLE